MRKEDIIIFQVNKDLSRKYVVIGEFLMVSLQIYWKWIAATLIQPTDSVHLVSDNSDFRFLLKIIERVIDFLKSLPIRPNQPTLGFFIF